MSQMLIKNFSCFKISDFRNGIKEIFKDTQRRKSRKSFLSAVQVINGVKGPVPLRLLSQEDQAKSSNLVGSLDLVQVFSRLVLLERGFAQVIDKEVNYAHTPQATTLKII